MEFPQVEAITFRCGRVSRLNVGGSYITWALCRDPQCGVLGSEDFSLG